MRYKYGSSVNEYGFLLSDHLNSTTIIVSSTGTQEGKLLYRALGEERPISGINAYDSCSPIIWLQQPQPLRGVNPMPAYA